MSEKRPLSATIGSLEGVWTERAERKSKRAPVSYTWTEEQAEEIECRSTCAHCGDFDRTGPLREVRAAFAEHLASAHPEIRPAPRRRRGRR